MSAPFSVEDAIAQLDAWALRDGLRWLRVVWVDLHGVGRSKWLRPKAWAQALRGGLSMVSTLSLKDTGDRTAWPVFAAQASELPGGLAGAQNLLAMPRPASLRRLPWAPGHAWVMADLLDAQGVPAQFDARAAWVRAESRMRARGWRLQVGLELEFHAYRILDPGLGMLPHTATWPAQAPTVGLLHPGYQLLSDVHADANHLLMDLAAEVADGLDLPLASMEVEMGPSQFEAVFEATDALAAADAMVAFRLGFKEAAARHGLHVSFMCRPPFETIMSSGWHLHHSVLDDHGDPVFAPRPEAGDASPADCGLSRVGQSWLAGLLTHANALAAWGVPTTSGYARFGPNALAPQSAVWGFDNRGAMLRVLGQGAAMRIENRVNEPAANPYLVMAAHVAAGLNGVDAELVAPEACETPYASVAPRLPDNLADALEALSGDAVMRSSMGDAVVDHYTHIKRAEWMQYQQSPDQRVWASRTYFSRV